LIVIGFAVIRTAFERLRARNPRWGLRGIDDVAGLPLAALILSAYFFVLTPVINNIIRTSE
jgi:STE24 endopeptidase